MLNGLTVVFVVHIVLLNSTVGHTQFRVIRQWKYVNYTWPTPRSIQTATANGLYIPENIVIAGIIYSNDWYYLTMPRMKNGVPATLGRITAAEGENTAPLIAPFPSWEFNKLGDCNSLQNVQNIEIDSKGQMWIIDGGHTASLTNAPIKNCSAKILIFDLKSNAIASTYIFPESVVNKSNSFLYDLVIDGEFAYITDNCRYDPGIIVFSRQQNRAWKIRHSKSMQADPSAQHFTINGVNISTPINIAGIAISPQVQESKDRQVYYCPLSSFHLYSVNASVLQNESNSNNGLGYPGEIKDVGVKQSQTDGMIMTDEGILYYGLLGINGIAKWDSHTPFATGQKILTKDSDYVQWANAFTRDSQGNIIVLTNTLQEFVYRKLDLNESNFWILSAQIREKKSLKSSSVENNTTNSNTTWPTIGSNTDNVTALLSKNNNTVFPGGGSQAMLDFSIIIILVGFHIIFNLFNQ